MFGCILVLYTHEIGTLMQIWESANILSSYENNMLKIRNYYNNKPPETIHNHPKPSATTHPTISAATKPTCDKLKTTQTGPKQFISM